MTAHAEIVSAPEILNYFRAFDDITRHKVLQLLVREFPYAFEEFYLALNEAACEMIPVGEDDGGHYRSEGAAEVERDNLYPSGLNMEASRRHRMSLERDVLTAERYAAGRIAMMHARTEPMPNLARAWGDL